MNIVGVKFKEKGKTYYFNPNGLQINKGDAVIVETVRGLEFGYVSLVNKDVAEENLQNPLKNVIRVATEEDYKKNEENKRKEKEAFEICVKKAEEHKLNMKFIEAEYTFDNSKVIFYFSADGRIDFRELVKDLAAIFKTRIELRQIGVRDEAKMIGGLGHCGREFCCHKFLNDFQPVSIKMAKDQSLSLNPTKISGFCGRLMCCLAYEQCGYEEKIRKVPRVGSVVSTSLGDGTVVSSNILKEEIKVKLNGKNDDIDLETFKASDVKVIKAVYEKNVTEDMEELKKLED